MRRRRNPARRGWVALIRSKSGRPRLTPLRQRRRLSGGSMQCFVEIPIAGDPSTARPRRCGAAVHRQGTNRRNDSGCVSVERRSRAISRRVRRAKRVAFKATAGLHHPLRGDYALTYATDSARGTMYGFLNLFLASVLLQRGGDPATARELIEERSPDAVRLSRRRRVVAPASVHERAACRGATARNGVLRVLLVP